MASGRCCAMASVKARSRACGSSSVVIHPATSMPARWAIAVKSGALASGMAALPWPISAPPVQMRMRAGR